MSRFLNCIYHANCRLTFDDSLSIRPKTFVFDLPSAYVDIHTKRLSNQRYRNDFYKQLRDECITNLSTIDIDSVYRLGAPIRLDVSISGKYSALSLKSVYDISHSLISFSRPCTLNPLYGFRIDYTSTCYESNK